MARICDQLCDEMMINFTQNTLGLGAMEEEGKGKARPGL